MRDVSNWLFLGYGEKSTLEKEDLESPDEIKYVMKYPRPFDGKRVNWEDINEVIAAEIARLLNLKTVQAEVAYRKGKRGCLMLHFIDQYRVDSGETGASLLFAEFGEDYDNLRKSNLKSKELIKKSFTLLEGFSYFDIIKFDFVAMIVFDILIGNQDRHPFNWQILFKENKSFFGPLYDNGASLGWQLSDKELQLILRSQSSLNRFFNKMKVKAGLFENKQPPLKAIEVLYYCKRNYVNEVEKVLGLLQQFNLNYYKSYINQFPLISTIRKEFLKVLIEFRLNKIIKIIQKEDE